MYELPKVNVKEGYLIKKEDAPAPYKKPIDESEYLMCLGEKYYKGDFVAVGKYLNGSLKIKAVGILKEIYPKLSNIIDTADNKFPFLGEQVYIQQNPDVGYMSLWRIYDNWVLKHIDMIP